jgi:DNA-binding response OmpR family regulator
VKPFDTSELRARLQARLKGRRQAAGEQLVRGPFRFNRILQRAAVLTNEGEKDLRLTPFEFRVLYFLASREPEIFSRSALLKGVIDGTLHVNEDTIYTHISALRRKLGTHAVHLGCIARVGYRFLSIAPLPDNQASS